MPSKARKAASRQARLSNRRKRRDRSRPQDFVLDPSEAAIKESEELLESGSIEDVAASPGRAAVATAPARARGARRTRQQRAAAEAPASVYQYLGREVRQIGMISSVIVAILVVLTFVLG